MSFVTEEIGLVDNSNNALVDPQNRWVVLQVQQLIQEQDEISPGPARYIVMSRRFPGTWVTTKYLSDTWV